LEYKYNNNTIQFVALDLNESSSAFFLFFSLQLHYSMPSKSSLSWPAFVVTFTIDSAL